MGHEHLKWSSNSSLRWKHPADISEWKKQINIPCSEKHGVPSLVGTVRRATEQIWPTSSTLSLHHSWNCGTDSKMWVTMVEPCHLTSGLQFYFLNRRNQPTTQQMALVPTIQHLLWHQPLLSDHRHFPTEKPTNAETYQHRRSPTDTYWRRHIST